MTDAGSSVPGQGMEEEEAPTKKPDDKPDEAKPKEPFKKRLVRGLKKWGKRVGIATLALAIIGFITLVLIVRHFEEGLPQVSELKNNYHPPQVTRVLARDGTVLAEIFTERRTVVSIQQLPAHVKLAVLAAEDAGFYEHEGLNYWGILRAMLVNAKSGKIRQGGSTITQQVVKNTLTGGERDYRRKIREALLARRLEQECSKDEILELYLNQIYFGQGRYGIEEAARHTFGKPAKDLTIAEAALLAGTIANPEHYSPKVDMKKAMSRREYVLGQMRDKGFLGQAQYDVAIEEPVRLSTQLDASAELAPEAVEVAKKMLYDLAPETGPRGGFTIYTTIDPKLQAAARKALRDNLAGYDKRHGLQGPLKMPKKPIEKAFDGTPHFEDHKILIGTATGADDAKGLLEIKVGTVTGTVRMTDADRYNPDKLPASVFAPAGTLLRVSLLSVPIDGAAPASTPLRLESGPEGAMVAIDVRTRSIVALVGNYEAIPGGLDRATQSRRQPGSTFKPIVYSYALHTRRYTPATLLDPTPRVFGNGYKPGNYEGWKGTDPLRLREAIANSVNVPAVQVLDDIGPQSVVTWGQSLGITSTLKPDLSLALGSYELKPIELAGAYATFASGGTYEEPTLVTKITGPDGKDVDLVPPIPPRRVLDESEAYLTTSLLESVVDHGTAVRAKSLGRPVAGKTGTSNFAKDTWFAGFSTDMVAVTWVGYDDGKSLGGGETGASVALPGWIDFMKIAHDKKPPAEFSRPGGITTVQIDPKTGKLSDAEGAISEMFLSGTEPSEKSGDDADAGAAMPGEQ
jgi:penicillin-binding protein 1A